MHALGFFRDSLANSRIVARIPVAPDGFLATRRSSSGLDPCAIASAISDGCPGIDPCELAAPAWRRRALPLHHHADLMPIERSSAHDSFGVPATPREIPVCRWQEPCNSGWFSRISHSSQPPVPCAIARQLRDGRLESIESRILRPSSVLHAVSPAHTKFAHLP